MAFEVAPGNGAAAVEAARALGLRGLAVTMPHKHDVARVVDVLDPTAERLGVVNTVVFRDDGTTLGVSTDGDGLIASLHDAGASIAGSQVAVLGAGGAGRAIIEACGRGGAAGIVVVNRSAQAAHEAAALAAQATVGSVEQVETVDVVINTTPLGMGQPARTAQLPVDPAILRSDHVVVDIVYHPLETGLLAAARRVGATAVDGLGMLVHQAALQQTHWFGTRPDVAVMRQAAEAELVSR